MIILFCLLSLSISEEFAVPPYLLDYEHLLNTKTCLPFCSLMTNFIKEAHKFIFGDFYTSKELFWEICSQKNLEFHMDFLTIISNLYIFRQQLGNFPDSSIRILEIK